MSQQYYRHFFKCPDHGEIDIQELVNPEHRPIVELVCPTCGKRLEAIWQAWEVEPMSEKARGKRGTKRRARLTLWTNCLSRKR